MALQATPGTDPAIVPRPTSGGGTRGLGESFQPDLNTGTGNYQIPLWFPRGPNQFAPKIALTYSTGFGNGEFGLGWSLQLMKVTRNTDFGVPTYRDGEDRFYLLNEELAEVTPGVYRHLREERFLRAERQGEGWLSGIVLAFRIDLASPQTDVRPSRSEGCNPSSLGCWNRRWMPTGT